MPADQTNDEPVLLDYEAARQYINVSRRRIKELKANGDLAYVLTNNVKGIRFRPADLDEWIARNRIPSRHEDRRAS